LPRPSPHSIEQRGLLYILGVRERTDKLVRDVVLNDAAPFVPLIIEKRAETSTIVPRRSRSAGVRYIVCINHQEAAKDAADRTAILAALERQLHRGDKALVGNTGFRSLPQDRRRRSLRDRSQQG